MPFQIITNPILKHILLLLFLSGILTAQQKSGFKASFPNPFNPSTTIKSVLPEKTSETLAVYNVLGENVKDLFMGEMESGFHQVNFDASNLPCGVCVYKISAGNFTSTKKMLLIK